MKNNKQINTLLDHWNKIKKQLGHYVDQKKLNDVQRLVKIYIKKTEKDLRLLLNGDIKTFKTRLNAEKKQLEKLIDKTFSVEIKKARKFVTDSKKELLKLQKQLEHYLHVNKPCQHVTTKKAAKVKKSTKISARTIKKSTTKKIAKKK